MKIEGPNKTSGSKGPSKTGAKKGAGGGEFDSMIGDTEETASQSPAARTSSVSSLGALLSLQEADGSTSEEAKKRAKKRGIALLDHLDQIRIGLLTGELKKSTIQQLAQTIATHRDSTIMDPKLTAVLDEIDLRAQVELAKLEQDK